MNKDIFYLHIKKAIEINPAFENAKKVGNLLGTPCRKVIISNEFYQHPNNKVTK